MRAVAGRVGVSATALYRHFRDKEALLQAVVADGRDRFAARLFAAMEGADPRDRLRRTGLAYVAFAVEEPEHFRVFFLSGADLVDETAPPLQGVSDRPPPTRQFLLDRLRDCADAGLLAETEIDTVAVFLWAEVHGLAVMWVAGGLDRRMPRPLFEALVGRCVERAVDAALSAPPAP